MKTILVFSLIFLFPFSFSYAANPISPNCTYKGIKLYGKVKVVDSFPDIKIKTVQSFPHLKVKTVNAFANDCGEWQFVDSFPDFKVKFVQSFPDIKVKFVESFPGL